MDVKSLILRQFRVQFMNRALNVRNLTTQQNLNTIKKLCLIESRCLLPVPKLINQTVRNSKSYLPKRKRGYVWQGRKEEFDYQRSGLFVAFYWCFFLVAFTTFFYWKKGLIY